MLCITLLTPGCKILQTGQTRPEAYHSTTLVPDGRLDFGWRLSGARAVAPLQVFSDNSRTWLHWHPNQTVPAILANHAGQEQVLRYTRQDPYTIIEGQWSTLTFRAGRQQAHARRVNAQTDTLSVTPDAMPATSESAAATGSTTVNRTRTAPATHGAQTDVPSTHVAHISKVFVVTPEDQHLRQALVRWSGISGWHFTPEHWSVDVDIPLSAGASFSDDFVDSVQALLLSTELSDRPLQPCFYSNQVLRVVPYAETCDRTTVPGAPV